MIIALQGNLYWHEQLPDARRRHGCFLWWRRCSCHPVCPPSCCRRWRWGQRGCWYCPQKLEAEHRKNSWIKCWTERKTVNSFCPRKTYPLALLLRCPILLLDTLLELTIRPVEEDLCTLAGYQQTLHLVRRNTPVRLHCGILSIPLSLCWEKKMIKAMMQNKQRFWIHSRQLYTLMTAHRTFW